MNEIEFPYVKLFKSDKPRPFLPVKVRAPIDSGADYTFIPRHITGDDDTTGGDRTNDNKEEDSPGFELFGVVLAIGLIYWNYQLEKTEKITLL